MAQEAQVVKIIASDGVKLSGEYFSPDKPGPGILLLSMCDPTTDKSEWENVARKLQSNGFHVLTFDYRSFGESEGQRPKMMGSMEEAMIFWRENWLKDVESAYSYLLSQKNVDSKAIGIGGASCGVFMGLDLTFHHPNVKTFVSLGGPIDESQKMQLREKQNLPILIISANEGPALEWSDNISRMLIPELPSISSLLMVPRFLNMCQ